MVVAITVMAITTVITRTTIEHNDHNSSSKINNDYDNDHVIAIIKIIMIM